MVGFKQDMPPSGGYNPINVFPKKKSLIKHAIWILPSMWAITYGGIAYARYDKEKAFTKRREDEENRIALTPFLLAEQQRMHLKQLVKNRDYEKELMKDVPGWELGKWFDKPVYNNPRNLWLEANIHEFYSQSTLKNKNERAAVFIPYL
ncbi:NADH dehydrogenase 1 alpha subcomplex subunit 13 ndufa13/GRIM19 [Cichlidogyrus casuarinus]|uniref:NADH dehydrogenase [ubiquinone] 1 alpha subcomplex subunit 13 n=1 Tax=Cichlidogyrus casuarinus TaxID=1844966 RepID=A0ABD2PUB7_9PLAT